MRKSKTTSAAQVAVLFVPSRGGSVAAPLTALRTNAEVDANISWTGAVSTVWNNTPNWGAGGVPGSGDTALFNGAFSNQPNLTAGTTVGTLWMTTGVAQNVTISSNPGTTLNISDLGIPGTGILVDNTNAFTLTITASLSLGNSSGLDKQLR